MLLEGKKLLVTGVLDRRSIAFSIAEEAQKAGAEIVLTSFGRVMSITRMMAKRLPTEPDVLELDATKPDDVAEVCSELQSRWGRLDGCVHSIAFAPEDALGGNFLRTQWDSAAMAYRVSAFSAGPIRSMAAKGVPGFDLVEESWARRAPLGWTTTDPTPVGRTVCALLSDYMPATTGEVVHVDGGHHAMGTEAPQGA